MTGWGVDMRWATPLIIAAMLVFAACGGDDEPTEAEPDRPADISDVADEVEGETLVAPTPTAVPAVIEPERLSYVVQEGDLLGAIANNFNVPLGALVWVNEMDNPDLLQIGQELLIPTEEDVVEWEALEAAASPEPEPEADATDGTADSGGAGG